MITQKSIHLSEVQPTEQCDATATSRHGARDAIPLPLRCPTRLSCSPPCPLSFSLRCAFSLSPLRSKAHELLTEGVDLRPQLARELSLCSTRRGGPQRAEEVDERGRGLAVRLGLVVEGHAELVLVRLVVARHLDIRGPQPGGVRLQLECTGSQPGGARPSGSERGDRTSLKSSRPLKCVSHALACHSSSNARSKARVRLARGPAAAVTLASPLMALRP